MGEHFMNRVHRLMLSLCMFQDRGRRRDGTEPERETERGVDQSGARGQGMQYPIVREDPWEQFPYGSLDMGYH